MTDPRLTALGRRIERVALDPAGIEAQGWFRLARPLFALTGWRARVRYDALARLLDALAAGRAGDGTGAASSLDAAVAELAANVTTVERAAIARGRAPVAHAAWLRRAWELAVAADAALAAGADAALARPLRRAERVAYVPPLALAVEEPTPDAGAFLSAVATRDAEVPDGDARVVELELAAVDHLLAAARAEAAFLGRRRRLLVAARQALLDVSAALPLDGRGVRARADHVAREIGRIDRLEALGLDADVGLVQQARAAVDRGDPRRLWAALAAVDAAALASGDGEVARVTERATAAMWGESDPTGKAAREASARRSAGALLGDGGVGLVEEALREARRAAEATVARESAGDKARGAAQHLLRHAYGEGCERELLAAAVAVDGCFEVGGALAPVRVQEEERVLRAVRFPTQAMILVPAEGIDDLRDASISDPRSLLHDLVTGRLLARRYVRAEPRRRSRVVMQSEVRVYVLDGSSSMAGPRGRVRDALLVAELATLAARIAAPGLTRCTLHFRYFDAELHPVTRVDSVAGARAAMREVLSTPRWGDTNIQRALVASLEQIAVARELDPGLTRAQLVLVTDGEAGVDEAVVAAARARSAGLPVGVSVIALGQENAALRALVARQRAAGEAAFYHHLDDAQLEAIVGGGLDGGVALHLPEMDGRSARALVAEMGPLVEELAAIEQAREAGALGRIDDEARARRELDAGGAGDAVEGEGARARVEASRRDQVAIGARYARWFPAAAEGAAEGEVARGKRRRAEDEEVAAVVCALSAVAEVVALVGGSELARKADAIELLECLLPDARLTPARLRATLRDHAAAVAPALAAVHAAVKG